MPPTHPPLSEVLSPLIFGTATFNYQYNTDPFKLPTTALVHKALSFGVHAFDTSPYYGPSEEILGAALSAPFADTNTPYPRSQYQIITKVGRLTSTTFNYSAAWVRTSIARSLARLHTPYLDLVYCHDVEFVTPAEVLTAVRELRRIRDTDGTVKYVGISGYPVDVLAELAELVLRETGEPLDAVMSYGNFTLQNRRLESRGIGRLKGAGVDVVPNASLLGMGLLRKDGCPVGEMGDWHPAPRELRDVCARAAEWCGERGTRLEELAMAWALEEWACEVGPDVGVKVKGLKQERIGVGVIGVSNIAEFEEAYRLWRQVLDGLEADGDEEKRNESERKFGECRSLVASVREVFGQWQDFAWGSPDEKFVRTEAVEAANPK